MLSNKRLLPHPDSEITNLFWVSVLYINSTGLTTTPNIFSLCTGLKKKEKRKKNYRHGIFSTQGDYFSTFTVFFFSVPHFGT